MSVCVKWNYVQTISGNGKFYEKCHALMSDAAN